MKRVLYTGPQEALPWLKEEMGEDFEIQWVETDPRRIAEAMKEADVILDASMKVPLTAEMLGNCKKLALVITATTGADHIDSATLGKMGIPLLTLKTERHVLNQVTPAAELSWLLLLACARKFKGALQHVGQGLWERTAFPGIMLKGKTLGIVGCGRLGQWMGRYARAFDMKVIGFDPNIQPWPEHIDPVPMETLLGKADFITVHVPLAEETKGLIGKKEISQMKQGVVLVNSSRGAIVDEEALLEALKEGKVGAVGLDVLADEPEITKSKLWQYGQEHDQVIISPHIGGFSPDALELVLRHTGKRITDFFKNL